MFAAGFSMASTEARTTALTNSELGSDDDVLLAEAPPAELNPAAAATAFFGVSCAGRGTAAFGATGFVGAGGVQLVSSSSPIEVDEKLGSAGLAYLGAAGAFGAEAAANFAAAAAFSGSGTADPFGG